jgi:hypothetical protein
MLKILMPALAVSLLATLPVSAQPRPLNLRCKVHAHTAEAWGGSRPQGLRGARVNWQNQVLWHDGGLWNSYARACDKYERCSGRSGLYRCFVTAKPGRPRFSRFGV